MTAPGSMGMARLAPRKPPKRRGFAILWGDHVFLLGLLLFPSQGAAAGPQGKGMGSGGGGGGGGEEAVCPSLGVMG